PSHAFPPFIETPSAERVSAAMLQFAIACPDLLSLKGKRFPSVAAFRFASSFYGSTRNGKASVPVRAHGQSLNWMQHDSRGCGAKVRCRRIDQGLAAKDARCIFNPRPIAALQYTGHL